MNKKEPFILKALLVFSRLSGAEDPKALALEKNYLSVHFHLQGTFKVRKMHWTRIPLALALRAPTTELSPDGRTGDEPPCLFPSAEPLGSAWDPAEDRERSCSVDGGKINHQTSSDHPPKSHMTQRHDKLHFPHVQTGRGKQSGAFVCAPNLLNPLTSWFLWPQAKGPFTDPR